MTTPAKTKCQKIMVPAAASVRISIITVPDVKETDERRAKVATACNPRKGRYSFLNLASRALGQVEEAEEEKRSSVRKMWLPMRGSLQGPSSSSFFPLAPLSKTTKSKEKEGESITCLCAGPFFSFFTFHNEKRRKQN